MKIVHICLSGLYMDGWGYQDNLIAKYHRQFGHDVTVIANRWVYDKEGNYTRTDKREEVDCNGVKIIRIATKGDKELTGPGQLVHYIGLYETLRQVVPDIIFLHNPQILDCKDVARYMKSENAFRKNNSSKEPVRLYVDSHSDYSNSGRNFLSKHIKHGLIFRHQVKKLIPYTTKFYGVLPARVDFMIDRYHTPKDKTELLVMAMDDDKAEAADKPEIKRAVREKLGIAEDDFLVITGGKIDHAKKQTLLLIEAVQKITNPKLKLVVFGSVVEDMKEQLVSMCHADERIRYLGWMDADETYPYFAASDLAVFPGRHSVMWEQVAGQGIPMVVKYWEGTTHVDVGGNTLFLYRDSAEEIRGVIERLQDKGKEYQEMKKVAEEKGKLTFSYRKISKSCIQ